jgi:hypothetical protein
MQTTCKVVALGMQNVEKKFISSYPGEAGTKKVFGDQ